MPLSPKVKFLAILFERVRKGLRGAKDANPIQATRSDEVNRSARRKNSCAEAKTENKERLKNGSITRHRVLYF